MPGGAQVSRADGHGGGGGGPTIAGNPESFPSDAELARALAATRDRATLCTLTADGYPYGSAVSYVADDDGAAVVLISEMAEHTVNARGDDRASVLVTAPTKEHADPLSTARLTLLGRLRPLDDPGKRRDAYLQRHPYASYYADFSDFGFWLLDVERCRFVGGFGHMSWVTADDYRVAAVDPLAEEADGIVAHMNEDHSDANLLYVQALAGLGDATEASMVGIDRYGMTLRARTPAGPRLARVAFPEPLRRSEQTRPAVIERLHAARQAAGPPR